jgi:hypothetical protein
VAGEADVQEILGFLHLLRGFVSLGLGSSVPVKNWGSTRLCSVECVPFAPPDVGELARIPCGEHDAAVSTVPGPVERGPTRSWWWIYWPRFAPFEWEDANARSKSPIQAMRVTKLYAIDHPL